MYLNRGLVAEKSILALPLYGSQWSGTYDPSEGYYSTDFERKVTLSEVNRVFQSKDSLYTIVPTLDETSMTNYFFLEFPDNTSIEGWYDDSTTLAKKMDLALFNKFKGVGLYALGYDLGKEEVWNVVAEKFTGDIVYIKDPIKEIDGYPIKIAAFFQTYKQLFIVTFALVTLAMIIALAVAFSDWKFRETILARQLYRILTLTITCLILLLIFFVFGWLNEKNWSFFLFFYVVTFIAGGIDGFYGFEFVGALAFIALILPYLAVAVRRMNDVGKSGWFILVPFYNFILLCTPSKPAVIPPTTE
jgi:hypothetical protein